ncbi:MAG: RsmE family RNA methyltransferase [Candidatus Eisenbacteria bacterium]
MPGRSDRPRFFFAPPAELGRPSFRFPPDEEDHIRRVLRLKAGSIVTAVDGEGGGARVRLRAEGSALVADVVERFRSSVEPSLRITLAAGLLKGQEMDLVVERSAEIGVAVFQPFLSERSVPTGPRARGGRRVARWERLARSGMKTARGAALMEVRPVENLRDLVPLVSLHERSFLMEREAPPLPRGNPGGNALLLVGPEGGLADEEKRILIGAGASPASLGPRNLRAGTASLAAAVLLLGAGASSDPGFPSPPGREGEEGSGPEVVEK